MASIWQQARIPAYRSLSSASSVWLPLPCWLIWRRMKRRRVRRSAVSDSVQAALNSVAAAGWWALVGMAFLPWREGRERFFLLAVFKQSSRGRCLLPIAVAGFGCRRDWRWFIRRMRLNREVFPLTGRFWSPLPPFACLRCAKASTRQVFERALVTLCSIPSKYLYRRQPVKRAARRIFFAIPTIRRWRGLGLAAARSAITWLFVRQQAVWT